MNIDELIDKLEAIRNAHGGELNVLVVEDGFKAPVLTVQVRDWTADPNDPFDEPTPPGAKEVFLTWLV